MKVPFSFGLRFFLRMLLPGFVLAAALSPAIISVLSYAHISYDSAVVVSSAAIILGWLCSVLDMPIYMLFEGRRYWNKIIWDMLKKREEKRLEKLYHNTFRSHDRMTRIEAGTELRMSFPFDDKGTFTVAYPTRLGNLIAAYEGYPERVYGFSSTFLWTRLWLKLDKDRKEEVDSQQAIADSTLYVTFSLVVTAILCLIYCILMIFGIKLLQHDVRRWMLLLCAGFALAGARWLYLVSVHVHRSFGRIFCATFDVFLHELSFPIIQDHVDRILAGKPIDAESRNVRNGMIVDFMLSSRITDPKTKSRVWIGDWNAKFMTGSPRGQKNE